MVTYKKFRDIGFRFIKRPNGVITANLCMNTSFCFSEDDTAEMIEVQARKCLCEAIGELAVKAYELKD